MLHIFDINDTLITRVVAPVLPYGTIDVLPRRKEVLARVLNEGHQIALYSNEGGAALGFHTEAETEFKIARLLVELGLPDHTKTAICYNLKKAPDPAYQDDSRRKPSPLMILELIALHNATLETTLVVGNDWEDHRAAKAAGVKFKSSAKFFGDPVAKRPNQWRQVPNELLGNDDAWERKPADDLKLMVWLLSFSIRLGPDLEWAWIVERDGKEISKDAVGVAPTAEQARTEADRWYNREVLAPEIKKAKAAAKAKAATKDKQKKKQEAKAAKKEAVASKPKLNPFEWHKEADGSFTRKVSDTIELKAGLYGKQWRYAAMAYNGPIPTSVGVAVDEELAKKLADDWFASYAKPVEAKPKFKQTIGGL